MGLIVDTSVLINAERAGKTVAEVFEAIFAIHGEVQVGISAVTLMELAHGVERAKLEEHRRRRLAFLDDLTEDLPVHPVSGAIARRAGEISGREAAKGIVLPFEDLLIGATALQIGFGVLTPNVRHSSLIPDLLVATV